MTEHKEQKRSSSRKELFSWLKSFAAAFLLALLISTFVVQPTKVLGNSMYPTLHDHQRIFVSKLIHTFSTEPDYGDIVIVDSRVKRKRTVADDIIEHPIIKLLLGKEDEPNVYIKRVVGMPGDTLQFRNHQLYRNGKKVKEPYLNETMLYTSNKKIVVPANHIFVMGDNRNHSTDSRDLGPIPMGHILGKKL